MQRRAIFSLVNLAVAAAALFVLFAYPRYAGYAVYAFFGWFIVSLTVVWFARGTPPVSASAAGAGAAAGGAAATVPGTSAPSPQIGFCVYCAADLPPGAGRCPACGHAAMRLAAP